MSVCPSVRTEQLGSRWTDFHEIWYLNMFIKHIEEFQVLSKCDQNNGAALYVKTDICTVVAVSR
jgi:hypothetical protein